MIFAHRISLVLLAACLAPMSSVADKIGDPAAPLAIKEWLKGPPVDIKAGTNIFVIEFWATLSTASRANIPKLNELQKKYKDKGVVIVAISDDPPDKIQQFFATTGVQIDCAVAADDQRKTARNYMVAYGQNGIPHTFVVGKDGKVLWHGYPAQGLEQALADITAGRYNLDRAMKLDAVRAQLDDYRKMARLGDPKAAELGRKILAARTNNAVALCDFAYRIITDVQNTNRDLTLASQALDRSEQLSPTNTSQLIMARGLLIFEQGHPEEGLALARRAMDLIKDPKDKEAAEVYVNIMEGRFEVEKEKKRRASSASQP
jgi:peroxiredoxin